MELITKEYKQNSMFTNIKNVNIHYERYDHPNPKSTLVFVHGFLSSTYSFRDVIPLVTKDYSALALDLPGFGMSEKSLKFHYSYHNYGQMVIELIKKLGFNNVVVVGHSMGGQIALHAARQAPDIIKRLVLIGSSGYLRRARKGAIYLSYLPSFSWFVKQWFKRKNVYKSFLDVFHNPNFVNDNLIQGYLEPFYDKDFFKSLIRLLRHREGDLTSRELNKITTPSLLIWGDNDNVVPLEIGHRLKSDLQNSELFVMKESGHLPCEEKPLDFYEKLDQWLQTDLDVSFANE